MAESYNKLLMYIVDHQLMQSDSLDSEIDATASRDVDAEKAGMSQERRADAERLAEPFTEGLRRAIANGGRVEVEDTDAEGDGIADAFARFLVTTNLATSESNEIGGGHYRYRFSVDVARLREIAQGAGIAL